MMNNIFIVIITILICLIIFILIIICICYLFKKTSIQNQHINSTEMGKTKNKEGNIPNSDIIIEETNVNEGELSNSINEDDIEGGNQIEQDNEFTLS